MDGRCATCDHWLKPINKAKPGLCLFIHDDNAASRAEVAIHPKAKRGQNAELRTRPNFGCIEWTARENV